MFKKLSLTMLALALLAVPTLGLAADAAGLEGAVLINKVAIDTMWVLVAGFLVFWMNAGFALVETGLCRAKNSVNILAKNFVVFAISSIAFYVVGWGFMFGDGNSLIGTHGLFM